MGRADDVFSNPNRDGAIRRVEKHGATSTRFKPQGLPTEKSIFQSPAPGSPGLSEIGLDPRNSHSIAPFELRKERPLTDPPKVEVASDRQRHQLEILS